MRTIRNENDNNIKQYQHVNIKPKLLHQKQSKQHSPNYYVILKFNQQGNTHSSHLQILLGKML